MMNVSPLLIQMVMGRGRGARSLSGAPVECRRRIDIVGSAPSSHNKMQGICFITE
ncbi:hypothetical protein [Burkholderia sp. 22313]|uniref:hypothetical protein n=1 Tax=Burkholderia sp. 22313 TaxID=3453908 RepID=UPI003F86A913